MKTITSRADKKVHNTPEGNCKTKGLVYAAECTKCAKQYVAQTTTELRVRISGHRSWMEKNREEEDQSRSFDRKDEGALADHLKQCQHLENGNDINKGYKFTILMKNPENFNKAEQTWIYRLLTMSPYGLNLDKPCGVSATMIDMSMRQTNR